MSPRNQGLSISDWLAKNALLEYESNFLDIGYTHFEAFKKDYAFFPTIFEDLLKRFGVDKYGHRIRIMMALREGKKERERDWGEVGRNLFEDTNRCMGFKKNW